MTSTTKQVNSTADPTTGRNWHYLPLYQPVTNADGSKTVTRVYYAVREDPKDPYVLDKDAIEKAANASTCFDATVNGTTYTFVRSIRRSAHRRFRACSPMRNCRQ